MLVVSIDAWRSLCDEGRGRAQFIRKERDAHEGTCIITVLGSSAMVLGRSLGVLSPGARLKRAADRPKPNWSR